MWRVVIEKCVTLVWLKQFSFGHCVACCHWKVCNISLTKTVHLWSLCGVLLLIGCIVPTLPSIFPENTRRWTSVDLMLAQSRRRWAIIKSTFAQCLVFAGFSCPPLPYSGNQSHTTRRGRASCSLWYAPVANVCDLLLFLDENRVIFDFRHFLKGHFPGWRFVHSIVFPLWRISYDLTQKIIHCPQ